MGTHPAHKHLGERFGRLWFVAVVAFEYLAVKLPFPISGNLEIVNAPSGGDQIARVGTVAIASALGSTFSPRRSDALLLSTPA